MNQDSHDKSRLRRHSNVLMYAAIILAAFFGFGASARYVSTGRLILALWSLVAVFLLPRAVLGLLLLGSRDPGLPLFMSRFLWRIFGKRLNGHKLGYSRMLHFDPTWKLALAFAQEATLFVLALVPLVKIL